MLNMKNSIFAAISVIAIGAALLSSSATHVFCAQTQSATAIGNKDVDKTETAIGDLVADSVRAALQTDVALVAASELKAKDTPFGAGRITSDSISNLISYPDDPLAVVALDGKTIRQVLERAVSIYPQPNLGFFQVSGMRFVFDAKQPTGSRVTSITIGTSPIVDSQQYSVAVTNSMANGALGYWKIWSQDAVMKRLPDTTIEKAVEKYFDANPSIKYNTLDRITAK